MLKTLPLLFAQYTTSLRKHRAAIFSQGTSTQGASSRSETNIASMKFFASCHKVLDTEARDELTWNTISEMTDIVARENLYDSQSDPTSSLKHDVGVALEYLHDHQKGMYFSILSAMHPPDTVSSGATGKHHCNRSLFVGNRPS